MIAVLLRLNFPANFSLCLLILFVYSWRTTNNKHWATLNSHKADFPNENSVWLAKRERGKIAQKYAIFSKLINNSSVVNGAKGQTPPVSKDGDG